MEAQPKPPTKTELAIINNSSSIVGAVKALTIANRDDMAHATDMGKTIRGLIKAAEEERKQLVGPLNDHVKMINARFKIRITDALDEAKRLLDSKMLKWQSAENARRQAEIDAENARRQAEAEAERARLEAEAKAKAEKLAALGFDKLAKSELAKSENVAVEVIEIKEDAPRGVRSMTGNLATVRKVKDFELIDIALVPKTYLLLNESWVRSAIQNGTKEIPGIRIFERDALAIR